jgi:thioredoxin-related protein
MKRFLVFICVLLTTVTFAQDTSASLNWLTNLEEAEKIAKEEHKPILIYFTGSDWCAPCKKLKEDFFNSEEFATRAEKLILVLIDRPHRVDIISEEQLAYNKTVIAKYNKENTFPKLVIVNAKGIEKGRISGYSYSRDTANHFAFVDEHLSNYK